MRRLYKSYLEATITGHQVQQMECAPVIQNQFGDLSVCAMYINDTRRRGLLVSGALTSVEALGAHSETA